MAYQGSRNLEPAKVWEPSNVNQRPDYNNRPYEGQPVDVIHQQPQQLLPANYKSTDGYQWNGYPAVPYYDQGVARKIISGNVAGYESEGIMHAYPSDFYQRMLYVYSNFVDEMY